MAKEQTYFNNRLTKRDGKWAYFDCCGRCSYDNMDDDGCKADIWFFSEEDNQAIEAMTDLEKGKLTIGKFEGKAWFRVPEPNWKEEIEKCKASPYYWYTNYCYVHTVDGPKLATTRLSEEEFNKLFQGYIQGKEQPIIGSPD